MKAILFDKFGEVMICQFASIDKEGKVQWVVMTPGRRVETVRDYYVNQGFDEEPLTLLCDSDEVATADSLLRLLGCYMEHAYENVTDSMQSCLQMLKSWHVRWDYSKVDLKFVVIKNRKGGLRKGTYSFYVECDNTEAFVADVDGYDELKELFGTIRSFLQVVRRNASLSLGNVTLELFMLTEDDIEEEDKKMFNKIINNND